MKPNDTAAVIGTSESAPLDGVTIRPFETAADHAACVALQRLVWGESYSCVPAALLKVAQRVGAVASGAFGEDGELLGFVFGLTGVEDGRVIHWSHMLAVHPSFRDRGIGSQLKRHQLSRAREVGAERIDWTFDPLVARNAYLNVNRLRVQVRGYARDMYDGTGSDLHSFGTDRLLVSLPLRGERPPMPQVPRSIAHASRIVNAIPGEVGAAAFDAEARCIRIRIPEDIASIADRDPATALAWRRSTREAFVRALDAGFIAVDLQPESGGGWCYVLVKPERSHGHHERGG